VGKAVALAPGARHVVGQRKGNQDRKEKEARDNHRTGELFARTLDVHEEQDDQRRLNGRDKERYHGVKRAEIHECRGHGGSRQDEQDGTD